MSTQKPAQRPTAAKGEAKGEMVTLQFSEQDRKRMELAAQAQNQSVSDWIRDAIEIKIRNTPGPRPKGVSRIH
jgi:hypothetical protein